MSITTLYTKGVGRGSLLPTEPATRANANANVTLKNPDALGNTQTEKENVTQQVSPAELEQAVKKLNEFIAPALQSIQFTVDKDSNQLVVKVVDTATNKVLRQIPNEEAMKISKSLDKMQGLMIRQTA